MEIDGEMTEDEMAVGGESAIAVLVAGTLFHQPFGACRMLLRIYVDAVHDFVLSWLGSLANPWFQAFKT